MDMADSKLTLIEYRWNGTNFKSLAQGNTYAGTLTFDPNPRTVTRDEKVEKRIRRAGRNRLQKYKARYKLDMDYTLQGSCSFAKMKEISFYNAMNSKFEATFMFGKTDPAMKYDYNKTYSTFPTQDITWASASVIYEKVFVIIEEVKFTATEGRKDWFDYNIKLKRIDCGEIFGYSDANCGTY
jgi:hypothetical protein